MNCSIVGVAVDGEYHNTNVDYHFPKALCLQEDNKPIFACTRDGAHLIELAGEHSRGQKGKEQAITVPWFKETFHEITAAKYTYGLGKNLTFLNDEAVLDRTEPTSQSGPAQESDADQCTYGTVKKLQAFSNARYNKYSGRVLSNFRNNFRPIIIAMEKMNDPAVNKLNRLHLFLVLVGWKIITKKSERHR